MSQETSSESEELLEGQAMGYALGTLSDAEHAQFETCMACPLSRAASLAAEYHGIVATMTAATLPPCPPPAPDVKSRLMEAIRASDQPPVSPPQLPPNLFTFIAGTDVQWTPTPYRGVRIRELSSASPDFAIIMVACDAGATFPAHDHSGAEDVYMLTGDATINGRLLGAGDFLHSESGTHHHEMTSRSGCQALLITSRKNYSPRAARAYGIAHRVVEKVGRALGVKVGD